MIRDVPAFIDQAREWRGRVYQARARVRRLEGAWPDPSPDQARMIAQSRRIAATLILAARRDRVRILASRGRSHV
jgi:hypothetical protein